MEKHVKIKICGITKREEIRMLNEASVDYAGFVFYEKSKRFITLSEAAKLKSELDPQIKSVAVTVSPNAELVKKIDEFGFDIIQIHGEIDKSVLETVQRPVWIAVNAGSVDEAEEKIKNIEEDNGSGRIEAFVFDAPNFGSGQTSDWAGGRRPETAKMFVLAGGLDGKNVSEGIAIFAPDTVDVSSSVEGKSGKDMGKISAFTDAVRKGYMK